MSERDTLREALEIIAAPPSKDAPDAIGVSARNIAWHVLAATAAPQMAPPLGAAEAAEWLATWRHALATTPADKTETKGFYE